MASKADFVDRYISKETEEEVQMFLQEQDSWSML